MTNTNYNLKKGVIFLLACYSLWGFQPLYWNLCSNIEVFFLLAMRIVLAALFCFFLVLGQGKLDQLRAIFKDRKLLLKEIACSVLLFLDWAIFLWAIQNGHVMEVSFGYYCQPIFVFFLGALFFHEKLNRVHLAVLACVIIGICFSVTGFGRFPYIAVALMLFFAIYEAIKKTLGIDGIVATSCEIILMVPLDLIYLLGYRRADLASLDGRTILILIGGGIITAMPMLLFAIGNINAPLMYCGIFQYISPTLSIFCSLILGEELTRAKLITFAFILLGVAIFVCDAVRTNKKAQAEA